MALYFVQIFNYDKKIYAKTALSKGAILDEFLEQHQH